MTKFVSTANGQIWLHESRAVIVLATGTLPMQRCLLLPWRSEMHMSALGGKADMGCCSANVRL